MRVNVYAEEMTDRVEIIAKEIDGHQFTGLRIYLELPATGPDGTQHQGPFIHRPGDDDSSAVTFWGKRDLREVLRLALAKLDAHYAARDRPPLYLDSDTVPMLALCDCRTKGPVTSIDGTVICEKCRKPRSASAK